MNIVSLIASLICICIQYIDLNVVPIFPSLVICTSIALNNTRA